MKCDFCGEEMKENSCCTESETLGICVECEYHNIINIEEDEEI